MIEFGPAGEIEFTSCERELAKPLVLLLAVGTMIYGLTLAVALPWSLAKTISSSVLGPVAGAAFALLGGLFIARWCVVQALAFSEHYSRLGRVFRKPVAPPFVSILVPAYNESETIIPAILSLIALDYPKYEIIVVDDGSNDDTFERALGLAGLHQRCSVQVIRKVNGGKWSALNAAFQQSTGDLILCVDADSRLSTTALSRLVARVQEPGVSGACGQVTIRNRHCLLARMQAVEYLCGNGGMRAAMSKVGLVTVVPGPIGLYTREILDKVKTLTSNQPGPEGDGRVYGPLSHVTFAEDFQLSLSVLALGGRIVYEPSAIAYTKCPENVEDLLSQRYRWMRGTWQVFWMYLRHMRPIANANAKRLDYLLLVLYPVDIYVAPILNFFFWGTLAIAAASGMTLVPIGSWIAAVVLLNVMTACFFALVQDDDLRLIPLVVLLDLYQSVLVNSAWVIGAVDEIRGQRMRWM